MNLSRSDRSARLDALAAQYALGTLSPRARRRMARIAHGDAAVAAAIRGWEIRLSTLAEAIPGVMPSPRIWQGVQARLGLAQTGTARKPPWWASLGLWRGLAFGSFAVALDRKSVV